MIQLQIQKSIYEKLTDDLDLIDLVNGVFDHVPQGQDYPYITIGEDTSLEWDTDTNLGQESTLTIHTWSREYGRAEVKTIMSAIYRVLHRQPLEIDDGAHVLSNVEFSETFLEADGVTRHGVMRVRVIVDDLTLV
jgi:hypothetical protein